jgi:hypothetical protein
MLINLDMKYIYTVIFQKFRSQSDGFSTDQDCVSVIADSLEEAVEKGKDYAELVNQDEPWEFYDITSVTRGNEVFMGLDYGEDQEVEITEVETPENGILYPPLPENWSPVPLISSYEDSYEEASYI